MGCAGTEAQCPHQVRAIRRGPGGLQAQRCSTRVELERKFYPLWHPEPVALALGSRQELQRCKARVE
jgi:hypothetical protein